MGHYPIKCIHCMREIPMDERMVKLDKMEIESVGGSYDGGSSGEEFDINTSSSSGSRILYKSIRELRENGIIKNESDIMNVKVSPEFLKRNPGEFNRPLLKSIYVEGLDVEGQKMNGVIRNFYCPHCRSRINNLAGQMPIYIVSLLGPSSAGKTVYLTILHAMLSGNKIPLPEGYLTFDNYGSQAKEFSKYVLNIRRNNMLPETTQENKKDPYLLKVTYRVRPDNADANKQCLLGLVDMRGELLQGAHNDALTRNTLPQFKLADGFVMLVDPETLDKVYTSLPEGVFGGRTVEQLNEILDSVKEVIMEHVTGDMGKIDKPSVIALAKMDILYKYNRSLRIPLSQPVISPQFRMVPGTPLNETYYGPMSNSTRGCIDYLSGSFSAFLQNTFQDPYFVSVSALGPHVGIQGNRLDDSNRITPIRVADPLLYLLMKFGFTPLFSHPVYSQDRVGTVEMWLRELAENDAGIEAFSQGGRRGKK